MFALKPPRYKGARAQRQRAERINPKLRMKKHHSANRKARSKATACPHLNKINSDSIANPKQQRAPTSCNVELDSDSIVKQSAQIQVVCNKNNQSFT